MPIRMTPTPVVEDVADQLNGRGGQSFAFVDNQYLDKPAPVANARPGAVCVGVLLDADAHPNHLLVEGIAQAAQGAEHRWRVEHRARARQRCEYDGIGWGPGAPVFDQRLGHVPVGVAPGRQRLAHTRRAEAQANVAVSAHGGGEFDEASVLLCGNEGAVPLAFRHRRHGPSSS
jgi:hypothetical protein